jgi:hypothetical protein
VYGFANKITEVGPATVGTQENQNSGYLSEKTGYTYLVAPNTRDNAILYNNATTNFLGVSGRQLVTSDTYAQRSFTWGKFSNAAGQEFWHFNTHLPHNLGAASSTNTHAGIAQDMLAKINELVPPGVPTMVTCDCNPFASNGASRGSFEDNLNRDGFTTAYIGTGQFGGFGYLDKIFTRNYAAVVSGQDHGPGTSDHPAITADIVF